jgi:hypothetical protein
MRMKIAVASVVAGLVVAGAVGIANAVATYESSKQMMSEGRSYQIGYVAGAADMLFAVGDPKIPDMPMSYVRGQAACLTQKQLKLGQLTDWALRRLAAQNSETDDSTGSYNAAGVIATDACEP